MSLIRENLMNRPGYSPYCGDANCRYRMPRTVFDGEQFKCRCGWRSGFDAEFIGQYKARWKDDGPDGMDHEDHRYNRGY